MNPIPVMKLPLRELARAIDDGDVPRILQHTSRLLQPAGWLFHHPPPRTADGGVNMENGRGDVALLAQQCIEKLGRMRIATGGAGVAWDGTFLKKLLEFIVQLLTLLGPIFLSTTEPEPITS